jgi:hypothetical protein
MAVIRSFPPVAQAKQVTPQQAVRPPASGLAAICQDRYRSASMWRTQSKSAPADKAADTLMHEARRLYHGILSPDQEKLAADVAGVKINMVADRALVAEAWMRDVVLSNMDSLITIEPTPLPELSASAMDEAVRQIKDALKARLRAAGYPDLNDQAMAAMPQEVRRELAMWLADTARTMKGAALAKQMELAKAGAKDMERLIHDQLIEAGFRNEFAAFVRDFSHMPFAVLKAPSIEMVNKPKWVGDRWVMRSQRQLAVRRVNPWNLYWAPDAVSAQTGGFLAEIIPTRKDVLMAMAKLPGWQNDAVVNALEEFTMRSPVDWLARNPDNPAAQQLGWAADQTIDRLQVHGVFSGRELQAYGIGQGLAPTEFVEASVTLVGSHVLQAKITEASMAGKRPYHVVSFRPSADHFCGCGLANLGADMQVAAYAGFWSMLRNASYASGARGEADVARIKDYIPAGATPEQVLNQQFHFVSPDLGRSAGGASAFRFHNVPHYVTQFLSLLDDVGRRMDRATGIPAIASGGLDYATAGRSHAGLSQLLGSALKTLKLLLGNIDNDALQPIGEAFYRINMQEDKEKRFAMLDANVKARGTAGLLERELRKSGAVEALQAAPALAQLSQMGGNPLPPALVSDIVGAAAEGLGVDITAYPEMQPGGGSVGAVDRAVTAQFGSTQPVPVRGGGMSPAT